MSQKTRKAALRERVIAEVSTRLESGPDSRGLYLFAKGTLTDILSIIEPEARSEDDKKLEALLAEIVDELRALTSYPFNPSRKVSNKRRMEDVLDGVSKYAETLNERLAEIKALREAEKT